MNEGRSTRKTYFSPYPLNRHYRRVLGNVRGTRRSTVSFIYVRMHDGFSSVGQYKFYNTPRTQGFRTKSIHRIRSSAFADGAIMKKAFAGKGAILILGIAFFGWALCLFTEIPREILAAIGGALLSIEAMVSIHDH